ncbi:nicotinate-nucleotide adenylyltransferase [Streptococcus oriscaviae]|uniref:Probable nicotinate-nucleotide adenylyltransferase n=1 Tax=Streptococcus oriscaviae TaxID=2781599 RepID=A0ABX7YJD7_9STRE|nr:nicotinate-nucleotide adenylyltransferase [Streptococcus oriscaviae]QUE53875.1 nicotinate-nucleotide adenylyltransferase [Streptococcus oriscaviae]
MAIELLTPFTKVELETQEVTSDRKQVGLLAGNFNPVHNAHLLVADQVRQQLNLDAVLLMPELLPAYADKLDSVDDLHRLKMLQLAIKDRKGLGLETIQLEKREFCYTVDLITELMERHPDTDFYIILGADLIDTLPKWHRIDDLLQLVQFVGVQRPRYRAGTSYPLIWVDVPLMDLSSSMVRDFIKKDRWPEFLLPETVLAYIEEKGLYR